MIKIRRNIFETNSSSVHSLTIVSKKEYDAWKNGELLFDKYGKQFVPNTDEYQEDDDIYTYKRFWENIDYETFCESHTTDNGDKIVAFGYYGYDS